MKLLFILVAFTVLFVTVVTLTQTIINKEVLSLIFKTNLERWVEYRSS